MLLATSSTELPDVFNVGLVRLFCDWLDGLAEVRLAGMDRVDAQGFRVLLRSYKRHRKPARGGEGE